MRELCLGLLLCFALCEGLPTADTDREGRNIFANFLGNLGVLRIIPRECQTTSSFLKTGMCSLESKCTEAGGAIAGLCEKAGVCCVVPGVCGSQMTVKRSWFVNKEFPDVVDIGKDSDCELTVLKSDKKIKQVRLDFNYFKLAKAEGGICNTDSFRVLVTDPVLGETDVVPSLCGDNSGQHVYVNMPEGELSEVKIKVKLGSVKGRSEEALRSWRIFVTQLEEEEMAPKGCLQYFSEKSGTIKSLNYDSDVTNFVGEMNYDICFRKITELTAEADLEKTDPASHNICSRDFTEVDLEQSFTGASFKMLARRSRRNSETLTEKNPGASDKVISQIQQVVSQLKGGDKFLLPFTKEGSKQKNQDKKDAGVINSKKAADPAKDKVVTAVEKIDKEVEKLGNTEKKADEVKVNKDEGKKKIKDDVGKKANTKADERGNKKKTNKDQDITWLILDKDKDTSSESLVPEETVVSSGVKANTSDVKPTEDAASNKKPADISGNPLAYLFAEEADQHSTELGMDKKPDTTMNVAPNLQKDRITYSLNEAEEVLKNPACGGSYILVREREVCGTFRHSDPVGDKDKRFGDAERISMRTIEHADTALRFSIKYNDMCRSVAPKTTTAATTTTTTGTTTVKETEKETTTSDKPQRRVGLLQYLMGWY